MFKAIDISTSGLLAQRARLDVASINLAQADTVFDPEENGPFKKRNVLLAADKGGGVRVAGIQKEAVYRTEHIPGNPYADAQGNVKKPGIDPMVEILNGMMAKAAYEANITTIELSKAMINSSLRILA